jgi:biopolymer transport protein ExbD
MSHRPLHQSSGQARRAGARAAFRPKKHGFVLNITSMIDMFTILLIFLLVNFSSEDPVSAPDLDLPDSTHADGVKHSSVPVLVTRSAIIVDGATVAQLEAVNSQATLEIPELVQALDSQRDRAIQLARLAAESAAANVADGAGDLAWQGRVTLNGDADIPFDLLQRVIYSCGQASFADVSLAVEKVTEAGS